MVGIIGVGNMGRAIAEQSKKRLIVSDAVSNKLQFIKNRHISIAKDNIELTKHSDIIILAVKPHDVIEVLKEIGLYVKNKLIISIAAGIETRFIERILPNSRVIRVMPNMGILVGKGISAIAKGRFAKDSDLEIARQIFSRVGDVIDLKERFLDVVTAISGSGPAYYFLLTHLLEKAGCFCGLDKVVSKRLSNATFIGAGECAKSLDISMEDLIKKVASKGGTTESALKVFKKKGLEKIVQSAIQSAINRSKYLNKIV